MARMLLWLTLVWAAGLQWIVLASGNQIFFGLPDERCSVNLHSHVGTVMALRLKCDILRFSAV